MGAGRDTAVEGEFGDAVLHGDVIWKRREVRNGTTEYTEEGSDFLKWVLEWFVKLISV